MSISTVQILSCYLYLSLCLKFGYEETQMWIKSCDIMKRLWITTKNCAVFLTQSNWMASKDLEYCAQVIWTILMMILPFLVLKSHGQHSISLHGKEQLKKHSKYLLWNDTRMTKWWQNRHFGWIISLLKTRNSTEDEICSVHHCFFLVL